MKLSWLKHFEHSLHHFIFLIFCCIYLLRLYHTGITYHRFEKVLNEDAFGYYSILPAVFKYHDPQFQFLDSSVRRLPAYSHYIPPVVNKAPNGRKVIKYYSGVALLQLPFYLAGDILARDTPATGYEPVYHFAILVSVAFYLLLGLFLCKRILAGFGIHPVAASVLPFIMLFGSNLYCYTTYDPAYSHVYSFFALTAFLYFLIKLKSRFSPWNAIASGMMFGLIVFIRPLNGIAILFVPIVFGSGSLNTFFRKQHLGKTVLIVLSCLGILSIQSMLWFWQTGLFYVYPYGQEKLTLLNPRIAELVFSFDSGWAIYTPLPFLALLFSIIALIIRKQYFRSVMVILCSFAILYLLSCWYYLHYGCTAGCRPITEFYGPLIVLCGYSISGLHLKKWLRYLMFVTTAALIYYNQVIHFQFYEHILNWCHMDREKFSMVFMKTHPAYRYATSEPWDFSGAGKSPSVTRLPLNNSISINDLKTSDTINVFLPSLDPGDSSLLLDISFKCLMKDELNESFVRFLLSDKGKYVDLQNLLLRKEINRVDQYHDIHFEMLISKPVKKGTLHIRLESVDKRGTTILKFNDIAIRRIAMN